MNTNKYLKLRANARKWKHEDGGIIKAEMGTNLYIGTGRNTQRSQEGLTQEQYKQLLEETSKLNPKGQDITLPEETDIETPAATSTEQTDWTNDFRIGSEQAGPVQQVNPTVAATRTGVRSDRNNNPLNIRFTNIAWQGKKTSDKSDNDFEEFESRDYGWRAAYKNINKKITVDGLNSIRKLISSWAPANENNTEGYIKYVSSQTGIDPDDVLTANDERLAKIGAAMAAVESGRRTNIDWDDALRGFKFYLGQA